MPLAVRPTLVFLVLFPACGGDTDDGDDAADADADSDADTDADVDSDADTDTGSDTLAARCADWCDCMFEECQDALGPGFPYVDHVTCEDDCADFPIAGTARESGDFLECREYHCNAARDDAGQHCPHADGQALCVP